MGYLTRKPTPNEISKVTGNKWLEDNDIQDEVCLLLNGDARRCKKCRRAIRVKYLSNGLCPDCQQPT